MASHTKSNHRTNTLSRKQGTREVKQSFLIVCEGKTTEPDYFTSFRMTAATVRAVGQGMSTVSLVKKAINIREAEERKKKRRYDQCWVVFDKDDFPADDFNRAISLAEANGFRVAYSNQAFEYWFLLHFVFIKGTLHRSEYAGMLTKLIGVRYCKIEGFGATMYKLLKKRQLQAIRNAASVLKEVSRGNPAAEESSTTVHMLVAELNKFI